jgi:hypothetical protein
MIRRSAALASRIGFAISTLAVLSASVLAIERKPLPDFALTALDGSAARSGDLRRDGEWLLVYVRPACAPCDALMGTIDPKQTPVVPTRMVIVVGGVDATKAAGLAARFKDWKGTAWFADPGFAMKEVLPLAGAPVVFGMRGSMVEWSLAGVVPDGPSMRTALVSWVRGR